MDRQEVLLDCELPQYGTAEQVTLLVTIRIMGVQTNASAFCYFKKLMGKHMMGWTLCATSIINPTRPKHVGISKMRTWQRAKFGVIFQSVWRRPKLYVARSQYIWPSELPSSQS